MTERKNDTLLVARHADVLVTMDAQRREIPDGALVARGGVIEWVGATADLPAQYRDAIGQPNVRVMELRDHVVTPVAGTAVAVLPAVVGGQERAQGGQEVVVAAGPRLDDRHTGRCVRHEEVQEPVPASRHLAEECFTVSGEVDDRLRGSGGDIQDAGAEYIGHGLHPHPCSRAYTHPVFRSGYPHLEEAYWFGEGVIPEPAARRLLGGSAAKAGAPVLVASGR